MAKKEYGTRKKYHFIYKTINMLSGRYYIGMHSTDNLNDGYLGSGTYLKRSINKHGKENHSIEILEFLNSRQELAAREKEIVSLQEIAKKECMNLKVGGQGGNCKNAEEGTKRYWEKHRITPHILRWTGKKHSPQSIQKMKETALAIEAGKGIKNSQYGTCWITDGRQNLKVKKGTAVPEGWTLGRRCDNPRSGTRWITNGNKETTIGREGTIPDGWRLGRKIKKITVL
jgi:hypothetical protein